MITDPGPLPFPDAPPELGWKPLKDPASRDYQVAEILEQPRGAARPYGPDRNRSWRPGPTLDQLREGQCVAEGIVGTHNGRPLCLEPSILDFEVRRTLYHRLQHGDPWPGCAWGQRCTIAPSANTYSGTSTLTGLKEGRARGWWREFRWCGAGSGTLEADIVGTLATIGPLIAGTVWRSSMYETRPSGLIDIDGDDVGGHCYRWTEWIPRLRLPSEWKGTRPVIAVHNSWGDGFGITRRLRTGIGYLLLEDAMTLMEAADGGEAAVVLP